MHLVIVHVVRDILLRYRGVLTHTPLPLHHPRHLLIKLILHLRPHLVQLPDFCEQRCHLGVVGLQSGEVVTLQILSDETIKKWPNPPLDHLNQPLNLRNVRLDQLNYLQALSLQPLQILVFSAGFSDSLGYYGGLLGINGLLKVPHPFLRNLRPLKHPWHLRHLQSQPQLISLRLLLPQPLPLLPNPLAHPLKPLPEIFESFQLLIVRVVSIHDSQLRPHLLIVF